MILRIPLFLIALVATQYVMAIDREGRTLSGTGFIQNIRGFFQRTPSSRTPDYIIPEAQLQPPTPDEASNFYGLLEHRDNLYSNRYFPNPRTFQFSSVPTETEVAYVPVANPIFRPDATTGYLPISPISWQYHEDNSFIPAANIEDHINYIGHSQYGVPFTHSNAYNDLIQFKDSDPSSKVEPIVGINVNGLEPPSTFDGLNRFRPNIDISNASLTAHQEPIIRSSIAVTESSNEEPSEISNRFSETSFAPLASVGSAHKKDGSYNIHIVDNIISSTNDKGRDEFQPLPTEHIQIENGFLPIPAPTVTISPMTTSKEHQQYAGQALPHSQLFSDRFGSESAKIETIHTGFIPTSDQQTVNRYTYATPSLSSNPIVVLKDENSDLKYADRYPSGSVQLNNEMTPAIAPIIDEPKETKKPSRGNKKYTRLRKYQT